MGDPPPAQNILSGRLPLLRRTPGMIGSPQQRLEGFLLGPFHACNLIFLVSIQCRKPSLGQRRLQRCASFFKPLFNMACQLGKGIYLDLCFLKPDCSGQRIFSFPGTTSVCGSPSSQTTCRCSLLVKSGDNCLGGLDPCPASGRAT